MNNAAPLTLSVKEAAKLIGVKERMIYELCKAGKLSYKRLKTNGSYLISRKSCETFGECGIDHHAGGKEDVCIKEKMGSTIPILKPVTEKQLDALLAPPQKRRQKGKKMN